MCTIITTTNCWVNSKNSRYNGRDTRIAASDPSYRLFHTSTKKVLNMNVRMTEIADELNSAWVSLENAVIVAYDDGYSGLVWQIKQRQLMIENLIGEIEDKEYEDE